MESLAKALEGFGASIINVAHSEDAMLNCAAFQGQLNDKCDHTTNRAGLEVNVDLTPFKA